MPPPLPPRPLELEAATRQFLRTQAQFVGSAQGLKLREGVERFSRRSLGLTGRPDLDEGLYSGASSSAAWLSRVPDLLLDPAAGAWLTFTGLPPAEGAKRAALSLMALCAGAIGLVLGSARNLNRAPDALMRVAFGSGKAFELLREPLFDPTLPPPRAPGGILLPDIADLILQGSLRELLQTFAKCGLANQDARLQAEGMRPLGQITALTPQRGCAGDRIKLSYAGLGTTRPDPGSYSDILISFPTAGGGCTHQSVRVADPGFLDPRRPWTDSGTLTVTLPADISTGCVGLMILPIPGAFQNACNPGDLSAAAGQFQSALGARFGRFGTQLGQRVLEIARDVEGRQVAWRCADCQPTQTNRLQAGPPRIVSFKVLEQEPVYPRGTVTLKWMVENADRVEIITRQVTGSAGHELPPVSIASNLSGQITVNVNCTKRWEAQYVLIASNDNGPTCGGPVEFPVTLSSGFSHWTLGVGRADITDRRPDLKMAGFAYKQQKSSGVVQTDEAGNEVPLFARAFLVAENRAPVDRRELLIIVADIWTCTIAVKQAVLAKLNSGSAATPRFSDANVMLAGTHTHAGPGGYSDYALYNLTVDGFEPGVFKTIVDGIVRAANEALNSARPGRLFVDRGDVIDCGVNRSLAAFARNPEAAAGVEPTDRQMLLLKLVHDIDNRGGTRVVGMVNWYAIHPTSLGMYNRVISGDNKGWAAMLFESELLHKRNERVVAGFGNASAGDVSGNYVRDAQGRPKFVLPLDGEPPTGLAIPPRSVPAPGSNANQARMQELGRLQFKRALELFDGATTEVTGRLGFAHSFVDMSNVTVTSVPGAPRTREAALGVSFGAGSSEDSIAYATIGDMDPVDLNMAIPEGIDDVANAAGGVAALPLVSAALAGTPTLIPEVMGALVTGAPIGPATVSVLLPLVPVFAIPGARAFVAAKIAALSLAGEVSGIPDPEGTCTWELPGPFDLLDPVRADYVSGHGSKPIMFPVGLAKVSFAPNGSSSKPAIPTPVACPLVPHVLPLQLVRIGTVVLAGVPAEFTATAGRRLKDTLATAFGPALSHSAVVGYCNGYSGYVTTREEYEAQHYEGASTLYGEFTLLAYQQVYTGLAAYLAGVGPEPMTRPPEVVAVVSGKP